MSDQTPFVPPSGGSPVPPSAYGPPPLTPEPGPPRKKINAGVIVAIVSGAVLLVGGLVVGAVALTSVLAEALRENASQFDDDAPLDDNAALQPLVTGDEASPVAVEPLDCGGCFTDNDLADTIVDSDELAAVGLTSTLEPFTNYTAHYDSESIWFRNAWKDAEGDPEECFVTFPQAPISILESGGVADDGSIISYTGVYADDEEWSTLGQAVRIFEDDQDAVAYMAGLPALIASCEHYQSGAKETYWEADVTPAPALSLPPSVAGIGWAEVSVFDTRYYSFDLQRGNMVVRTALATGEEISEIEFRSLVEHVAEQLSEIDP